MALMRGDSRSLMRSIGQGRVCAAGGGVGGARVAADTGILLSFTRHAELETLCNALGQRLAAGMVVDGAVTCLMCAQNVAELVAL